MRDVAAGQRGEGARREVVTGGRGTGRAVGVYAQGIIQIHNAHKCIRKLNQVSALQIQSVSLLGHWYVSAYLQILFFLLSSLLFDYRENFDFSNFNLYLNSFNGNQKWSKRLSTKIMADIKMFLHKIFFLNQGNVTIIFINIIMLHFKWVHETNRAESFAISFLQLLYICIISRTMTCSTNMTK